MTTNKNLQPLEPLSILFADDEKELQEIARLELPFYDIELQSVPMVTQLSLRSKKTRLIA
jgi:hypothetical protein